MFFISEPESLADQPSDFVIEAFHAGIRQRVGFPEGYDPMKIVFYCFSHLFKFLDLSLSGYRTPVLECSFGLAIINGYLINLRASFIMLTSPSSLKTFLRLSSSSFASVSRFSTFLRKRNLWFLRSLCCSSSDFIEHL